MRSLIWIVEDSWQATARAGSALLPTDAQVTLLYVRESEAESIALGARRGLLGRRTPTPGPAMESLTEQSARELLGDAQTVLGRQSTIEIRSGRVDQEVVAASREVDLVLMARDGDRIHPGPHSLGPTGRFVLEHAPCAVLLVWPD